MDEWMQLASQEPETGWLCRGVSKMVLEGPVKGLMTRVGGNPSENPRVLDKVWTLTGHTGEVECRVESRRVTTRFRGL